MATIINWGFHNLLYGRDQDRVAANVIRDFDALGLEVMGLTEANDYINEVAALAKAKGYVLLVGRVKGKWSNHNALLVRDPKAVSDHWGFVATKPYPMGGRMFPSSVSLAAIVHGIVWVVGHAPVHAWVATPRGRRFIGKLARRVSYRFHIRRTALVFKRHPNHLVVAMEDWNGSPNSTGPDSPRGLARAVGGVILSTGLNTGHGEIDFAVARQAKRGRRWSLRKPKRGAKAGSDHYLIHGAIVR